MVQEYKRNENALRSVTEGVSNSLPCKIAARNFSVPLMSLNRFSSRQSKLAVNQFKKY